MWVHIIVTSPCDLFTLGLKQVFNILIYLSVGPLTTGYTDCMFLLMTVLAASSVHADECFPSRAHSVVPSLKLGLMTGIIAEPRYRSGVWPQ